MQHPKTPLEANAPNSRCHNHSAPVAGLGFNPAQAATQPRDRPNTLQDHRHPKRRFSAPLTMDNAYSLKIFHQAGLIKRSVA
ncbi:hypothetical protein [Cognatishimia sp. WU-CL00825]|uniref:hypothetical protein n=1 Tax=Cognatishimia sp. WU-CL00825 TaxID=3127658 RepID=UPI0033658BA3